MGNAWKLLGAAVVGATLAGCGGGGAAAPQAAETTTAATTTAPATTTTDQPKKATKVLYLHHSTGENIWNGGIKTWVDRYNVTKGTKYTIEERAYPNDPYPWANNPYDYWNLWVKNPGTRTQDQATLGEMAKEFDVISWKNCYVASDIDADDGNPSVSSEKRTVANYKLQYQALKTEMLKYPDTTFIVWTMPPMVPGELPPDKAQRAEEFAKWVVAEWDKPGDNIYLWDYRSPAVDKTYLRADFAAGEKDSHPNEKLSLQAAPRFGQRLVDVIEGRGDSAPKTGEESAASTTG